MSEAQVRPGYKRTEVGVIPEDWEVELLGCVADIRTGDKNNEDKVDDGRYPFFVRSQDIERINSYSFEGEAILVPGEGGIGSIFHYINGRFDYHQRVYKISDFSDEVVGKFVYYYMMLKFRQQAIRHSVKATVDSLRLPTFKGFMLALPSVEEQRAIAQALADADAWIATLDKLIAKKRALKRAAMDELLTGRTRLPGFGRAWSTRTIKQVADCLDDLRVPLNEEQRRNMPGPYPYCGANGIVDYISDYLLDDDVILLAEDGGFFEEYRTRPIAYRMVGKIWVNNHAHILKAKSGTDQGFLYYSLVHKNILPYISSGTRSKLNKAQMYKIEIRIPEDQAEQRAIAQALSDMDAEIEALERQRAKAQAIKQGMMQELLTGRMRLVEPKNTPTP